MSAIPVHLIGPRQRKNINCQIGHERRGARHIAPRRASPPASSLPVLRRAAPPQSLLFLPSQAGCSGIREPASRAPMSPPLTAPAPPPACNLLSRASPHQEHTQLQQATATQARDKSEQGEDDVAGGASDDTGSS